MELRILGASGGWPAPGRACSGYLITGGGARVWLDAGAGTMAELLRHVPLGDVDAIVLSHLHPDHCSDLGGARNAIAYGGGRRLPVYGPARWPEWFDAAVPDAEATREAFDARELRPLTAVRVADMTLVPFPVQHGVPTFGFRIEAGGTALGYSADSRPCTALVDLARGADLFLCEAFLSATEARATTVMAPEESGTIAADAGARRLLLTHLHPDADPATAVRRARTTFKGPVAAARPGDVHAVG